MKDLDYSLPVNWFLYLAHTLLFIGVLSDRYNGEKKFANAFFGFSESLLFIPRL